MQRGTQVPRGHTTVVHKIHVKSTREGYSRIQLLPATLRPCGTHLPAVLAALLHLRTLRLAPLEELEGRMAADEELCR